MYTRYLQPNHIRPKEDLWSLICFCTYRYHLSIRKTIILHRSRFILRIERHATTIFLYLPSYISFWRALKIGPVFNARLMSNCVKISTIDTSSEKSIKNIPFTAQQQPKSIRNISSSNLQQQVPINLIIYLKIARHIKSDLHPFGRLHAEVRYLRTLEPHETRRHQSQRPYPSFCPKRKAPAPIAVRNTSMEH